MQIRLAVSKFPSQVTTALTLPKDRCDLQLGGNCNQALKWSYREPIWRFRFDFSFHITIQHLKCSCSIQCSRKLNVRVGCAWSLGFMEHLLRSEKKQVLVIESGKVSPVVAFWWKACEEPQSLMQSALGSSESLSHIRPSSNAFSGGTQNKVASTHPS